MLRRLILSLSGVALGTLSCGHFSVPVSEALPPVSLAAPTQTVAEFEADPMAELAIQQVAANPMVERAIGYLENRRTGLSQAEIEQVANAIVREANHHELDPNLVMAVIHIESRGNSFALSPVGAMGIMQIMPPTGEELAGKLDIPWRGPQTLFDPIVNVRMGVAYLKELEDRYGNTTTALAAYNWGPGRIDSRIRRGATLPVVYSGSVLATYRAP